MPHPVEFDQEKIRWRVPAESEPPQARQNVRDWVRGEKFPILLLSDHGPYRVTIMVHPEAAIGAQSQLDVCEAVLMGEATVDLTGKRRKQAYLVSASHLFESKTYTRSAGVPGSLTLSSVAVLYTD